MRDTERRITPIKKKSLYRDEIKERLMDAILDGTLQPGDRIVETRWARELGVSQSPIREAIRELEMVGLVENIPYKGTIVREVTEEDLSETFRVRIALETLAVEEAIEKNLDATIKKMEKCMDAMIKYAEEDNIRKFISYDSKFHELLVESAENSLLLRIWNQCYIEDNTVLGAIYSGEELRKLAIRHGEICEAIRSGDVEIAKKAIKKHFGELQKRVSPKA